jgi:protein tyrosine phosphatase type IVA
VTAPVSDRSFRTPLLVAIAMVEKGMDYSEAVEKIRETRKGAINYKQLKYLKGYKKKGCALM